MPTKVLTAEVPAPLADEVARLVAGRHALTLEGMADVDAGRVISQADIEAWANGLDPAA